MQAAGIKGLTDWDCMKELYPHVQPKPPSDVLVKARTRLAADVRKYRASKHN